jgi:hypothetical protein
MADRFKRKTSVLVEHQVCIVYPGGYLVCIRVNLMTIKYTGRNVDMPFIRYY